MPVPLVPRIDARVPRTPLTPPRLVVACSSLFRSASSFSSRSNRSRSSVFRRSASRWAARERSSASRRLASTISLSNISSSCKRYQRISRSVTSAYSLSALPLFVENQSRKFFRLRQHGKISIQQCVSLLQLNCYSLDMLCQCFTSKF